VRATGSRAARVAQAITNGLVSTLNRSPDSAEFLTSNNVGYRMDALREAGLFDASFTAPGAEERELHARLRARGARLVYDAEILVEHRPDLTWAGFVRQQAAYGSGARRFRRGLPPEACKFGRFLSPRQYGAAVRGAWREVPPRDRPALLAGCLISQAAVCWGYLRSPS
jgi:hypothetical protein